MLSVKKFLYTLTFTVLSLLLLCCLALLGFTVYLFIDWWIDPAREKALADRTQLEKATIEEKEKRQADFLWIAGVAGIYLALFVLIVMVCRTPSSLAKKINRGEGPRRDVESGGKRYRSIPSMHFNIAPCQHQEGAYEFAISPDEIPPNEEVSPEEHGGAQPVENAHGELVGYSNNCGDERLYVGNGGNPVKMLRQSNRALRQHASPAEGQSLGGAPHRDGSENSAVTTITNFSSAAYRSAAPRVRHDEVDPLPMPPLVGGRK